LPAADWTLQGNVSNFNYGKGQGQKSKPLWA
jgi:hypothetical protein